MTSSAATPEEYLASLPDDRRRIVSALRETINSNLPDGYREGMSYGMIGWYVPLETFPDTYNGQPLGLVGLASQKNHVALYLNSVYSDPSTEGWFRDRYATTGKKLNMGRSCVRFRSFDEIPFEVIGETIARADLESFTDSLERARGSTRKSRQAAG